MRLSHSCAGAPGLGHGLSAARWPASAAACSAAPGTVIYLQCVPVVDAGTAPRMALPASATRSGTFPPSKMASTTERLCWQVSQRSASPDHLHEKIVFGHGSESAFLIQTLRWTVVSPYRQTQWQALRCCMALQRSQRSHCGAAAASWRCNGDIHQTQLFG